MTNSYRRASYPFVSLETLNGDLVHFFLEISKKFFAWFKGLYFVEMHRQHRRPNIAPVQYVDIEIVKPWRMVSEILRTEHGVGQAAMPHSPVYFANIMTIERSLMNAAHLQKEYREQHRATPQSRSTSNAWVLLERNRMPTVVIHQIASFMIADRPGQ